MAFFDFLNQLSVVKQLTGSFGEWLAKHYSKTLPGALVLHDVLIDGAEGHTSQIDLLIIGNRGVYVVEVKSFAEAKIYGDAKKSNWYYYKGRAKYEIYSPLKQNKKHVRYVKDMLGDFGDIPCFSVVVIMCEDYKISGEIESDTVICNSLPAMDMGITTIAEKNPILYDDVRKQEIYEYIKTHQYEGKQARKEHKQNVIAYNERLKEMKEQKICPYCKTELVLRKGKYGDFYGCSNYPKCKYTQKVDNTK